MTARFTTHQLSRLTKLSERRVLAYARAGVLGGEPPATSGEPARDFDFRDLAVLRAAGKLQELGLPTARVAALLRALRGQVGPDVPLSSLQLQVDNGKLVATRDAHAWEPQSGQQCFLFGTHDAKLLSSQPKPAPKPSAGDPLGERHAANHWFETALALEETDPEAAYEAYLRTLACNPEHVEATINIGRLCSAAGDHQRAAAYFRNATRIDPTHPVAHFNLAVTLHDEERLDEALTSYEAALSHDAKFADAHFNLATLLEQLGRRDEALRHLRAYDETRCTVR